MRRLITAVLAAAVLLVPAAGVARADDNSVYGAYVSRDADFTKLGKQVRSGLRSWSRSGLKRPKPALRALAATVQTCDELSSAIAKEQPSSSHGARGKKAALASVGFLKRFAATISKSVRAGTAGHRAKARGLLKLADRLSAQASSKETVARREFKAAGVKIKPR
jgi:hypothetical protein